VLLSNKDTITDSKIFNKVASLFDIILNLEVSAPVLFSGLLVLIWDDKVVDNTFLNSKKQVKTRRFGLTMVVYSESRLL